MRQKKRWQERVEDFERALTRLQEGLDKKTFEDLQKDGVMQRFEFTFELAWKTMKDYLEDQGLTEIASPKNVLRKAFQSNLIKDGDLWLRMLDDRNSLTHLYKQGMRDKVFEAIKGSYQYALKALLLTLQKFKQ